MAERPDLPLQFETDAGAARRGPASSGSPAPITTTASPSTASSPTPFIQGGSPRANEYAGDQLYMRDEVGLEMHTRGSVGISTARPRHRRRADLHQPRRQPVPRLRYTVFARVCGDGMEIVDRIQEGDRIERIQIEKAEPCR